MPPDKRRAIEAAILACHPWRTDERGRIVRGVAYPLDWKRMNAAQMERLIVRTFAALGTPVGLRTVKAAYYDDHSLRPRDPRSVDMPASIRQAADMLNCAGLEDRDALIDAIYRWVRSEVQAGRSVPLDAHALALAYHKKTKKRVQ
jgi:hypothetical protein